MEPKAFHFWMGIQQNPHNKNKISEKSHSNKTIRDRMRTERIQLSWTKKVDHRQCKGKTVKIV